LLTTSLDLVGDPDWPKEKISARLRRIRDERARLQRQLNQTERPDLDTGRATLRMPLDLLAKPQQLYRLAGKQGRRILNQAIFTRLYLDADEDGPRVTEDEPTEPFAPLMRAYRVVQHNGGAAAPQDNDTAADDDHWRTAVLASAMRGGCSSNTDVVEVAGIEPASFGTEAGLLRAQPAVLFSAPAISQASRRRAQPLLGFPTGPAAGPVGGVSLRCQIPGRRHSRADKFAYLALSGEGELILRLVGRYWFAVQDLRGCLRSPRPASPCLVESKSKPVTPC
jgi:hypothetical protein